MARLSYFPQNSLLCVLAVRCSPETFLWATEGRSETVAILWLTHTVIYPGSCCWWETAARPTRAPSSPDPPTGALASGPGECEFSSAMHGPTCCRTPVPPTSEATRTDMVSFHPVGSSLCLFCLHPASPSFQLLTTEDIEDTYPS